MYQTFPDSSDPWKDDDTLFLNKFGKGANQLFIVRSIDQLAIFISLQ